MSDETDPNRMDGAVPLDDIVDTATLSEGRIAYLDGNSTVHVAPPASSVSADEPLMREFSLSYHEASQLTGLL